MGISIIIAIILIIILVVKKNKEKAINPKDVNMADNPLAEMYNGLTREQKYSILNLLSSFQELARGNSRNYIEANKIVTLTRNSLSVTSVQADDYFHTHGQADGLMKQLYSISDTVIIDSLLYQCFGLVMLAKDEEQKYIGGELLTKTFEKLGYTEADIVNTIEKINAMNKMFS